MGPGCAGQLPPPAAAGRGRAGLGGRRLPRRRDRLRRRTARGGRASAAVASGADRRTRGRVSSSPTASSTSATTFSPTPATTTSHGARPPRSTRSTGPTRPCDGTPTRPPRTATPTRRSCPSPLDRHDRDDRPPRDPGRVPGAQLGDQHRTAARARGRGARRDDRRHRRPPVAVERRAAGLAAARRWRRIARHRHRPSTRFRCPCCATSSGRGSRWSSPTPPATTASPATRTSPASTPARSWPSRSSAAATLQALLVLENRLIRDAFTTERLDVVKLIAGQLAVSLDNAQLYADYRRIADEQAALRRVATLVARRPVAHRGLRRRRHGDAAAAGRRWRDAGPLRAGRRGHRRRPSRIGGVAPARRRAVQRTRARA